MSMEWIIGIALAGGLVFALAALLALRSKRSDGGSVPGFFHFDHYKQSELSKRGLFDKTRW